MSMMSGPGTAIPIAASIWPFWRRVTASTVEFSGSRLRNAADHPNGSPDGGTACQW